MPGTGKGRPVTVEVAGENGPVQVSAVVREAPPSSPEEVHKALQAIHRVRAEQLGVRTTEPVLEASILVGARRYDAWRMVEVSGGALHGLLGEVLLRGGRDAEAARSFAEAARWLPRHPRYHYCASVAFERAGETSAGQEALDTAKAAAGPRLKRRFTPGSNPLEDYRVSLLAEALKLRHPRGGGAGSSASGLGAPPRKPRARRAGRPGVR